MIPIPTAKVFRSRRGALVWSFWVLVAAVMSAGFGDSFTSSPKPAAGAHPTDALGMPVDDQNLKDLMKVMNAT